MNRILETDLLSLTGAKSLDPLSPPRRTPGQGEAFRFSLTEAGTERSASVAETGSTAETETAATALPAWMIPAEEAPAGTQTPETGLPEEAVAQAPDAGSEASDTVEEELLLAPVPAPAQAVATPAEAPADGGLPLETDAIQTAKAPAEAAGLAPQQPVEEARTGHQTQEPGAESSLVETAGETGIGTGTNADTNANAGERSDSPAGEPRADLELQADIAPEAAAEPSATSPAPAREEAAKSDLAAPGAASASGAAVTGTDHAIHAATTGDTAGRIEAASGTSPALMSASAPAAAPAPAPAAPAQASPFAPPPGQPMVTATPAEMVSIITDTVSGADDPQDRVVVRLDPPELGRVSIDFKIDAQGVQHITVTGETPEAMRHLRAMHFELVQALERQGLTSGDMTFRQETSNGQNGGSGRPQFAGTAPDPASERAELPVRRASPPPRNIQPPRTGGGLNIRL